MTEYNGRSFITEKQLMKTCIDFLRILEKQGYVKWFHDYDSRRNPAGLPDLIVWKKIGYHVDTLLIELKSPQGIGRLTRGQKEYKKFFKDTDLTYHIIDNFDDFFKLFDEFNIQI